MIAGQVLGHGIARTGAGQTVAYQMVKPRKPGDAVTLRELGQESQRWKREAQATFKLAAAGVIPAQVAQRELFADEVLGQLAENVRLGIGENIVAQALDGRVLGGMVYYYLDQQKRPNTAAIALLATDPVHQSGTHRSPHQLRGVGTSLVAVASRDFLLHGVQTVILHPIDEEARRFWEARGFHGDGPGQLVLRGPIAITALIGSCEFKPDCPPEDGCLICGLKEHTAKVRLPAHRP